jgi:hypothetical protein
VIDELGMTMNSEELLSNVQELRDKAEIYDCLMRYCRGVDRLDRELLLSAYHPDATDDHGIFLGDPQQFADWALAMHARHQSVTQHIITNHSCDLKGNVAHAESYYMFAGMNKQGNPLTVCGGRYIDRFEKRGGRWAIAARMSILEWQGIPGEIFVQREKVDPNDHSHEGTRDRNDPSYARPLVIKSKHAAFRLLP